MKKQLLTMATLAVFGSASMFAQQNFVNTNATHQKNQAVTNSNQNMVRCASPVPSEEYDLKFNELVEQYKAAHTDAAGRLTTIPATIPVIVHIIHNGTAVGSGANISAAQVQSQITALNADYAGTNADNTSVPATFQSAKAGDTQIQFCLATIDENGNTMAEPGIERMTFTAAGATSDPNGWSSGVFMSNFDSQIKPNTIWDPTKYMNLWVTRANSSGLLGYASFPVASTLSGLSGVESATTSGVVINYTGFGTMGTAAAPYNKGRTATHEVGHWLGLRHIWGDGSGCATDYCNDTPVAETANFNCTTHPFNVGGCSGNTTGEMFMNYMDYTPDACMYFFTTDQKTRMQTAMNNGTYRKFLGTHGLCAAATPAAPVAAFTIPATGCTGSAIAVTNSTSGNPTPTYAWTVSPSAGVTINTATSANPTITFANTGTYTVSVTATNTQGNNSVNHTITIANCTLSQCDTLTNLADTNTITIYRVGTGGAGGYLTGNNQYGDTHKGEWVSQSGISGSNVTGMITYFFANGTTGTGGGASGNVAFEIYNGNNTTGPAGAALRSDVVTLATIAANGIASGPLLAYPHTFSTPVPLTANEFHAQVRLPTTAASGDTAVILGSLFDVPPTNTSWEKYQNTWYALAPNWQSTSMSLAIFPIVCPASIGLAASELNSQISVFPNPSTGVINMAFALSNQSDVKIEVTNMLGQSVYASVEKAMSAGTKTVDLSHVSKGVYMVTISTAKDKMVRKVVID